MYKKRHTRNQHGVATLGITLMLLFIMTLLALYTAKTSIKEQQISANQYRAEQSLSTGNAALDWGAAYYAEARGFVCDERLVGVLTNYYNTCPPTVADDRATLCSIKIADDTKCAFAYTKNNPLAINPSSDLDKDGVLDGLSIDSSEMYYTFVKADGSELEYIPVAGVAGEIKIDDPNGGQNKDPVYSAIVKIVGIGHSDDDTGMRTVSVDMETSNIFGDPGLGASAFPLISKATTGANGSITIINRYDNRTIWSGDDMVISGSANTYILEDGLGWNCNDVKNHDNCVTSAVHAGVPLYTMPASDGQDTVNADIIDSDTNLANISYDQFFENFFGKTKEAMRNLAIEDGHMVTADSTGDLTDKDGKPIVWSGMAGMTPLVWVDVPTGVTLTPSGGDLAQLGTETDPMVLIVDGNLKIGGTGNVGLILVGAMYVTGTWDASANPVVQGMVIVETTSELGGSGTPTLIYDADLFGGKMGPPPGTIADASPGSWKDWE